MTFQKYLCNLKLTLKDFKQSKYIMIIHTLLLFFCTTLPAIITRSNMMQSIRYGTTNTTYYQRTMYEALSGRNGFIFLLLMLVSFATVFNSFSYLNNMRSSVFFGSMPHKRSSIYFSKLMSCIASVLIPFAIISGVNAILFSNFNTGYEWSQFFAGVGMCALQYVLLISVFAFSASLSCNILAQLLISALVFLAYPIVIAIIGGTVEVWLDTYSLDITRLDPYKFFPPIYIMQKTYEAWYIVYDIIYALVFAALGCVGVVTRKTENTNKFFAFDFVNKVLKYFLAVCGSALGGMIFSSVSQRNIFIAYFSYIIFMVIAFSIIQAVFEKSFKSMFSNFKSMAVLGIIIAIAVSVPILGGEKLDSHIPEKTDYVEFINSGGYYLLENTIFTDEADVKAALALMESAIETDKKWRELSKRVDEPWEHFPEVYYIRIRTDNLPFGIERTLNRVPMDAMDNFMKQVYDGRYKAQYIEKCKNFEPMNYYSIYKANVFENKEIQSDDGKFWDTLMSALISDIEESTYDEISEGGMFAEIHSQIGTIPVYNSFERAKEFLLENFFIMPEEEDYESARIEVFNEKGESLGNVWITDWDEAKQLLANSSHYTRTNHTKPYCHLTYYTSNAGYVFMGEIAYDYMPKSVQEKIAEYIK